jgi:hypothetical protein
MRHDESDEDAKMRRDSEWHAERVVDHYLDMHRGHLRALLVTYADDEAAEKLMRLREDFWGSVPTDEDSNE